MKPLVLIVGANRPEALESSYARAFKQLGWEACFWDPVEALQGVARGGAAGRRLLLFVHVEPWLRKANLQLLELVDARRPRLVLVIGTYGVRAGTLAQVRVKVPSAVLCCVYPDSPHNLDADRISCLPFFDLVTTSSPAWKRAFSQLNARRVEYLPFAADTQFYVPAQKSRRGSDCNLGFIGNWRPERETFLEQLSHLKLRIWGSSYWKTRTRRGSPLSRCWAGKPALGSEFAQICADVPILINVMDSATWPGPNMRAFEQSACRAFTLGQRSKAVTEIFTEGVNIECFDSADEAEEKTRFFLKEEGARAEIADAAYTFVTKEGHTYSDRVQKILEWVNIDAGAGPAGAWV